MKPPVGCDKRLTITDKQLGVRQVILLGRRLNQGTSLSANSAYDTRSGAETMLTKRLDHSSPLFLHVVFGLKY